MGEEAKKEAVVEETFDEKADAILDQYEKETQSETSAEKKPEGEEAGTSKPATAEVVKTEQVKEVEADASLSVEEKIAKIKEILGDDEKALDAYIKEKGYHKDPAWQKQRELIDRLKREKEEGSISKEDRAKLAELEKITSSREYIETSMRLAGYKDEAITKALREKGFEVKEPEATDDLQFITTALKIDPKSLSQRQKDDITDIAKIARAIAENVFSSKVPDSLKPIQKFIGDVSSRESANTFTETMQKTVKDEGILDWDKDIAPELNKYMDENPNATQEDVFVHFREFTRKANIERLKLGKRQEERDGKKDNLRQNSKGSPGGGKFPAKTGKFDEDADAILDHLGVT